MAIGSRTRTAEGRFLARQCAACSIATCRISQSAKASDQDSRQDSLVCCARADAIAFRSRVHGGAYGSAQLVQSPASDCCAANVRPGRLGAIDKIVPIETSILPGKSGWKDQRGDGATQTAGTHTLCVCVKSGHDATSNSKKTL
eukprot:2907581-Rhodomonas_salina.1